MSKEAAANENNAVTFTFDIAENYYFRPIRIELKAVRCGTDGGAVDVSWKNALGITTLETLLTPERSSNFTLCSYSDQLKEVASAAGSCSLIVNIYKLADNKQVGIGGIVINGEIKQDAASGIEHVETVTLGDSPLYNLQGARVTNPQRGIYIRSGKKVVVQ